MENLNLESLSLKEMDQQEMKAVNGGCPFFLIFVCFSVGYLIGDLLTPPGPQG